MKDNLPLHSSSTCLIVRKSVLVKVEGNEPEDLSVLNIKMPPGDPGCWTLCWTWVELERERPWAELVNIRYFSSQTEKMAAKNISYQMRHEWSRWWLMIDIPEVSSLLMDANIYLLMEITQIHICRPATKHDLRWLTTLSSSGGRWLHLFVLLLFPLLSFTLLDGGSVLSGLE